MAQQKHKKEVSPRLIKWFLLSAGVAIVTVVLLYTQLLVDELRNREHKMIRTYVEQFDFLVNSPDNSPNVDLTFFMDQVIKNIHFPIVWTDSEGEPVQPYATSVINVHIDTADTQEEQRQQLVELVAEMGELYEPLQITDRYGNIISKYYYSHSSLITRLELFPVVQILVIGGFIVLGYVGFSYIKRTEESRVWAGLAKEAAHQMGTPLSSMMAWIEILKVDAKEENSEIVYELERDIERLNRISHRFSKIGSLPERNVQHAATLIERVVKYYEQRLPALGSSVVIERKLDTDIEVFVNSDVFEWVIENLIKNAVEAIEGDGVITVDLAQTSDAVVIRVTDTGKGMNPQTKRSAFRPGFTTKTRGWGLGLSLCRRIIKDYHGGKIAITDTAPGKGTTFEIQLPKRMQSEL